MRGGEGTGGRLKGRGTNKQDRKEPPFSIIAVIPSLLGCSITWLQFWAAVVGTENGGRGGWYRANGDNRKSSLGVSPIPFLRLNTFIPVVL